MKEAEEMADLFSLKWEPVTICLIVASVLIIIVSFSILGKVKRALRKWVYTSIGSGKALLVGTLLFGGNEEVPIFLQATPLDFQQTIESADYDFDYQEGRLMFQSEDGVRGHLEHVDQRIILFVQTDIKTPASIQSLRQLAQSFSQTAKVDTALSELIKKRTNQKVDIPGGEIELKGTRLSLQLEKSIGY
ncbi:hypothetical protein [Brevibacillus migulae]|uniref:hypothetical protein n=1 Tax=Brevibacillus migulae TaxID=1644114 RepID=UPI00106EACA0|nr:hypothetical protein [Brevibacillus migulae]